MKTPIAVVAAVLMTPAFALAQAPAPGAASAAAPPSKPSASAAASPKGAGAAPALPVGPKGGERCFRLPLSDVAFGTENATKAAREKLEEYAQAERRKRKWPDKPFVRSNETVSCTVYLNLGPLGTEYRCLVTTTFCQK